MSNKQKALIAIVVVTVFGSAVGTVTKIGLSEFPTLSFAFVRFFLASILILPLLFWRKGFTFRKFLTLLPLSFLTAANFILFIVGLKTTTATISQLLYAATPLLTAAIMFFLMKEKLPFGKLLGVLIGFIGVSIILLSPLLQKNQPFSGDLTGNILIGIGVVCWSLYFVFSKNKQQQFSLTTITVSGIFLTTIILFPFFVLELSTYPGWWEDVTVHGIGAILYMAIIGTFFAHFLYQYAIKKGSPVFASLSFYLLPILAFFWANLLIGEQLTTGIVTGGLLALLGVFLATRK